MAYKVCPNCRSVNNEHAKNCVNCGYYINETPAQYQQISNSTNQKPKNKMGCLSFMLAILIFISIMGSISIAVKKRQKKLETRKQKFKQQNMQNQM